MLSNNSASPSEAERQPLLSEKKEASIPWIQMLLLACLRGARGSSFTYVFAIINHQVADLGVASNKVGYWSGLVEGAGAVSVLAGLPLVVYLDRFGRKTTLLSGVALASLSIVVYAFQSTIAGLIIWRGLSGLFHACQSLVGPMVAEISNVTNSARCYAVISVGWQLHAFLAPGIAGYLFGATYLR